MIVIKPNVSNKLTTISKSRIIKITYCFISYDNFLNYFLLRPAIRQNIIPQALL
ncbi:hypothetical protein CV657_05660 [Borreliella burgdorferi]|nr:hypothetical protein BBU72A_D0029 [Borreliella burgdorferi 72a]ACN92325.1 hypothetical protein BBU94A_D27 [Borreliella burgdorferi 94a]ADQ31221.1 Hypothetical protein BbuJD1_D23 [Borreliella burgdorferi JD1]PRQ93377.1 hypothetical protein CV682_05550 [Borreliella burgdorferi]PRQ94780.1 hypothetical protein CV688_05645 [Borreliella burgdorferi]